MKNIRISIACSAFILIMLGVVFVYSASAIYAYDNFGDEFYFLKKHVLALMIGFILSFMAMSLDLKFIRNNVKFVLIIAFILLALVLVPGIGINAGGARRWIDLALFNLQPSEIAKIAVILYLADFLERKSSKINSLIQVYLPAMTVVGIIMLIILIEPDLGTAMTIGAVGIIMLFISGARFKHILSTFLLTVPFLSYMILSTPYRKKRLLAFLNPWTDERGVGFQIVQSFLALGSGGLLGVGLGQSKQKLFFLPASHNDFIFSIIGEELGFLGTTSIMLLFAVIFWQGARAAFKAEDIFRKYLIFGIAFTIGFEVILNTGVATGLLPTKGMPLPFLSYGGTSLVMHMVAVALLLNAARH